jgi:hypothetical protein
MRAETHLALHVKCPLCSILIEVGMCLYILGKLHNTKFNENPFSRSRLSACGYSEANRRIWVTFRWERVKN